MQAIVYGWCIIIMLDKYKEIFGEYYDSTS